MMVDYMCMQKVLKPFRIYISRDKKTTISYLYITLSFPQVLTWTLLCLWVCASWADIHGWSSLSTSSSRCSEPFWLQPPSACSTTVSFQLCSPQIRITAQVQPTVLWEQDSLNWKIKVALFFPRCGQIAYKVQWRGLHVLVHVCDEMLADAIRSYSGGELTVTGPTATAGIFSTYPADYLSLWGGFVDQVRYRHWFFILRHNK